jgi:hypothetical protein
VSLTQTSHPALLAALILWTAPTLSPAAELKKETSDAFDHYVASAEANLEQRYKGDHFLWSDDLSPSQRAALSRGDIVMQGGNGNGVTEIKSGLIHDWWGAVFVRAANLAKTMSVVQDYPRHNQIYKPEVASALIRSRQDNVFNVYMRIVKSKFFLTDVLNTEHEIHFVQLDPSRVYSRSYSKRVAEVTDPGKPTERELPVGKDRGLLWRMNGYWFFEERDGGVYIECEEVSLSRDIPFGMNKLIGPILHSVPAESLHNSLEETRRGILTQDAQP